MSTVIKVDAVTKRYGDKTIIPDLSLRIENGEFFTLLGPSGCGKTTLLRMIAGFNSIEGGDIYFNDQRINDIPPYRRNIGMVFQNYAIFPHLSVRKNIEYGLRQRKMKKDEMARRVDEIMEIVKISDYADKSPNQLSGGQQQRVALARAIVIHPTVLLMDEPLSNLDAKLRVEMRSAIRHIQKDVDITTVYVTHDQEEALAVSDRLAVMNEGELMQVGTPVALYQRPANEFVANFVGSSNMFGATLTREGDHHAVTLEGGLTVKMDNILPAAAQGAVRVAVRPEEFSLHSEGEGLRGTIKNRVFLGRYVNYELEVDGRPVEVSQDAGELDRIFVEGDSVVLRADAQRINVFDATGDATLIEE